MDCTGNAVTKRSRKKTCLIMEWNIHNFSYLSAQCVPYVFKIYQRNTYYSFFFFKESKTNPNITLVFEYFIPLDLNKIMFLFPSSLSGLPSTQPLSKELRVKVNPAGPWEGFCYQAIVFNHK